jgi:phosphoserine phosphatase
MKKYENNQKYKLIIFDIDGTLTNIENPWKYIHDYCNTWHENAVIYKDAFYSDHITYQEFCKLEVLHWKGIKVDKIYEIFSEVKAVQNLHKSLLELKTLGFELVAISSGLQFVPKILELEKYFDKVFHNEIFHKNGFLNGEVKITVNHTKLDILDEYIQHKNIDYQDIISVGDGDNDVELAKIVGYSIAFNSKSEKLNKVSSCVINNSDFDFLKKYLMEISKK